MWIEDDEYGAAWWAAAGWAELLIERAHSGRGLWERAGRDTAGLLLYQAAVRHQCRPGLVQLTTVRRMLTAADLAAALQDIRTGPEHQYAAAHLRTDLDLDTGISLLTPIVTDALTGWPEVTPVEDLWPAGTLLDRGGGGPTW